MRGVVQRGIGRPPALGPLLSRIHAPRQTGCEPPPCCRSVLRVTSLPRASVPFLSLGMARVWRHGESSPMNLEFRNQKPWTSQGMVSRWGGDVKQSANLPRAPSVSRLPLVGVVFACFGHEKNETVAAVDSLAPDQTGFGPPPATEH